MPVWRARAAAEMPRSARMRASGLRTSPAPLSSGFNDSVVFALYSPNAPSLARCGDSSHRVRPRSRARFGAERGGGGESHAGVQRNRIGVSEAERDSGGVQLRGDGTARAAGGTGGSLLGSRLF